MVQKLSRSNESYTQSYEQTKVLNDWMYDLVILDGFLAKGTGAKAVHDI